MAELQREKLTRVNQEAMGQQLVALHAELDSLQRALAREHANKAPVTGH